MDNEPWNEDPDLTNEATSRKDDPRYKESMTSLPLQMSLHFNIVASPFIFVISIASFIYKYPYLSPTYQVILIAVHVVHLLIEIVRLALGYSGNLGEKIPSLSGFWITSLLLSLPITIFLAVNPEIYPFPAEIFLYMIHIIFISTQIYFGFSVIRRIGEYHVAQFKKALQEEEEQEDEKNK